MGEPETSEVDDDERLAYRSTGGKGGSWENFGEEGFDVDEDGAPVLLGRYVSVEPLVANRAEALDVYRTTELYTYTTERVGQIFRHTRKKTGNGKNREGGGVYLVGLQESEWSERACGLSPDGCGTMMCVPCGSPSASSQRSHPARGTAQIRKGG